ncbi:ABC transporter substrate-binding protein [Kibdelosporangium aridum]|uniref:ABC-type branched-chain amino acid transport system, substrate-binding protein n=1 Tax=Kibdelosporangium aridum TaxID=2030 RepID=A0A1Y5Y0V9_KIBAR|nr:ABC transporter substrate-binding protein [Kibdelosporangium aridum]SMD21768.1 ABC-type branched-chain amino acid transport system, substrate-binding protein [Kibdelosporangium aridum]
MRTLILVSLLLLSACAGAGERPAGGGAASGDSAPGVTGDTVVIGTHQPLTGPAAPGYSRISVAAKAMYSYINDKGGIHGRKIDYRVEDDGYNPTRTVEVVKKLVLQDQVFAIVGGLGTPTHSKVVEYLNTEGVPDVLVSSGALMWDDPASKQTFGFQVDYTREGRIQGKYIADQLPGKKVGLLFQNDDVGRDAQKGLDQFIADRTVTRQAYDPANTDVLPQVNALKSAGAEIVVCSCVPAFTALSILTAARLGYQTQFVVSSIGADPATLTGLLQDFAKRGGTEVSAPALLNGMIGTGYLPDAGRTDDPWIQLFREVHAKYMPNEPLTNTVIFGMAQAYTFAQALKLTGRDLTRAKLVQAMESGQINGPGVTPFGFSAQSHSGYTGAYVFQVNPDSTTREIQPPMTTDREQGAIIPAPTARKSPAEVALVGP